MIVAGGGMRRLGRAAPRRGQRVSAGVDDARVGGLVEGVEQRQLRVGAYVAG